MNIDELKQAIRTVSDFPKEGVEFKDITTLLKDPIYFSQISNSLYEQYKDYGITKVIGVESRGFIFGSLLARDLNAGFVLARKAGKLPAQTHKIRYELEYGHDVIEIHKDALNPDDVVLIHDDLLATGGTINAVIDLVRLFEVKNIYANFVIELCFLQGRETLNNINEIFSLIKY